MAGARSLHIRDRLNPIPDVIRTTRWGLQSEEHRSVPHEEILGDALGKYVGGVIPGGYAQEQDGEAGDPQRTMAYSWSSGKSCSLTHR